MDTNPAAAGFSASKLQRISAHLQENYIQPGKIAGLSGHGVPARYPCLLSVPGRNGS